MLVRLDQGVLIAVGGGERDEAAPKLRPRLSAPGTQHTITIEEPPADAPPGTQLPLI
jgi:hypothetical protein